MQPNPAATPSKASGKNHPINPFSDHFNSFYPDETILQNNNQAHLVSQPGRPGGQYLNPTMALLSYRNYTVSNFGVISGVCTKQPCLWPKTRNTTFGQGFLVRPIFEAMFAAGPMLLRPKYMPEPGQA